MLMRSKIILFFILCALNGCGDDEASPQADCSVNPVEVTVQSITDSECGANTGTVEVVAVGGTGPYQYRLGSGVVQGAAVFSGLSAGVYEIAAIDANNCFATTEVTVRNASGVNLVANASPAGGCNGDDGGISLTASDGTPPYEYRLDNGTYGTMSSFPDLTAGTYDVSVRDATGCEVTQTVRVLSGVSFATSIQPLIQNKCAISSCHNGNQAPDLRVFTNVRTNAAKIKELTGNRTMPQEGSLTQAEIDMIACWVDDGAPNN